MTTILIRTVLAWVFAASRREARRAEPGMTEDCFVVRQPGVYVWIGVVCMVLFAGIILAMAIFPDDTVTWWAFLIFFSFMLSGAVLAVYSATWEVRVAGSRVLFQAPLMKPLEFDIRAIERVRLVTVKNQAFGKIKIYVGGRRRITVESAAVGYAVLCGRLVREGIRFV